jgi:hypothetical protein
MNSLNSILPNCTLQSYSESVSSLDAKAVIKTMHSKEFDWGPKGNSGIEAKGPDRSGGITIIERSTVPSQRRLNEMRQNFDGPDSLYSQYFAAEHGVGFKVQRAEMTDSAMFVVLQLVKQTVSESYKLTIQTEDMETQYLAEDLDSCIETLADEDHKTWTLKDLKEGIEFEMNEDTVKLYNQTFNDYKKGKMSKDEYIQKANKIITDLMKQKKVA